MWISGSKSVVLNWWWDLHYILHIIFFRLFVLLISFWLCPATLTRKNCQCNTWRLEWSYAIYEPRAEPFYFIIIFYFKTIFYFKITFYFNLYFILYYYCNSLCITNHHILYKTFYWEETYLVLDGHDLITVN